MQVQGATRREEVTAQTVVIQVLDDTTACCAVGGSTWNSLRAKPTFAKVLSYSANVYASPAAVVASMVSAKPAVAGGLTRSGLGTNSKVIARPPGASAANAFAASPSHVGTSKWWRKLVNSTTSYGPPQSTSNALPGRRTCRFATPARRAFSFPTASTFGQSRAVTRALG